MKLFWWVNKTYPIFVNPDDTPLLGRYYLLFLLIKIYENVFLLNIDSILSQNILCFASDNVLGINLWNTSKFIGGNFLCESEYSQEELVKDNPKSYRHTMLFIVEVS